MRRNKRCLARVGVGAKRAPSAFKGAAKARLVCSRQVPLSVDYRALSTEEVCWAVALSVFLVDMFDKGNPGCFSRAYIHVLRHVRLYVRLCMLLGSMHVLTRLEQQQIRIYTF